MQRNSNTSTCASKFVSKTNLQRDCIYIQPIRKLWPAFCTILSKCLKLILQNNLPTIFTLKSSNSAQHIYRRHTIYLQGVTSQICISTYIDLYVEPHLTDIFEGYIIIWCKFFIHSDIFIQLPIQILSNNAVASSYC